jgi:hypothetical protein
MPGLTHDLKFKSELHEKLANAVRDRITASKDGRSNFIDKWAKAEETTQAFLPEREIDRLRRAEREGGKPQYTTIQIPYSYALLMAAHTYWTTVFLARSPVWQFAGRHGESEMQIQAMEALVDFQMLVGKNIVPLTIWLYDVGKYGQGIIGTHWEEKEAVVSEIVNTEEFGLNGIAIPGTKKKVKQAKRIKGYHGNKLSNIRPFDFFPDPRIPLHLFQNGEFCAVLNPAVSMNRLIEGQEKGRYINLEHLKKNRLNRERRDGSRVSNLPDGNKFGKAQTLSKLAADSVELYECYIELIPKDWNLGTGTLPEKWVFTISSDFEVVIGAQPLGAYHNEFPFSVIEMEPEGYSLFNRGIPEIMEPVQNTVDWLINSHFYNVRKSLNNQFVIDPSRLVMKDAENPLPGGFIRMKPRAYGQDARTMLHQVDVQDLTRSHINDLGFMLQVGERVSGINEQVQGVAAPSSRRSAAEVRSTNTFSISRMKASSEYFSAMGFAPLGQIMVQNSQQYMDADLKLRVVGDLAEMAGPRFVDVTPDLISGFYDFVPVDGTLPADRFAQASLWTQLFAQMQRMPEIAAQYDIAKIFGWVAQLAGLKNIQQFKLNVQPDGQLQEAAARGDVVPIRNDPTKLPPVTQIPGTGQVGGG